MQFPSCGHCSAWGSTSEGVAQYSNVLIPPNNFNAKLEHATKK